jgi:hypothetical protein
MGVEVIRIGTDERYDCITVRTNNQVFLLGPIVDRREQIAVTLDAR